MSKQIQKLIIADGNISQTSLKQMEYTLLKIKIMRKMILLGSTFAVFLLAPNLADACSGTFYACGDEVTIGGMIEDANENCPSGSSFTIEHCDGNSFPVSVQ